MKLLLPDTAVASQIQMELNSQSTSMKHAVPNLYDLHSYLEHKCLNTKYFFDEI